MPAALAPVEPSAAPIGGRLLRGLQRRYLVGGLVISAALHLAGLGAYWGAVKMSHASPLPKEMQLVAYADVPPPPIDEPPPEPPSLAPAPPAAVEAPPSGVVVAVPDEEIDTTFTFASQSELAAEQAGVPGGTAVGTPGGTGTVAAYVPPPPPPPPPPAPEPSPPPPEVFEVAEVQPVLIGGLEGLQRRVQYPDFARRAGIEGQVVVQFVVDERGNVTDPVVLRSPNAILSKAAVDAVRDSRFEPGQQRGRPVKVRFAVPITFRLR